MIRELRDKWDMQFLVGMDGWMDGLEDATAGVDIDMEVTNIYQSNSTVHNSSIHDNPLGMATRHIISARHTTPPF